MNNVVVLEEMTIDIEGSSNFPHKDCGKACSDIIRLCPYQRFIIKLKSMLPSVDYDLNHTG